MSAYTVTGAITITGSYFPTSVLGTANNYSLTQTADAIDSTDFATAQANGGFRTHNPGLRTVNLELTGFYALSNAFAASLEARSELIIEINPDGNLKSLARGFFKASSHGQDGDVGALEEETVSFTLNVPDPSGTNPPEIPFGWQHESDTTLSTALQKALTSWLDETKLDYRYLSDGVNGDSGTGVLTDISLSGGLETMNEFSISVQGDGDLTVV